jgi:hypothetical protein
VIRRHVSSDQNLSDRVKHGVASTFGQQPLVDINLKTLSNIPLLASIYAQTRRLYVKTFTLVSTPLNDVSLGQYWLPNGSLGLVNSAMAPIYTDFWNNRDGAHPVTLFWADRLIIDPNNPTTSPSMLVHRNEISQSGEPHFFLKGLEGSSIPYGGKQCQDEFCLEFRC